MHINGLQLIVPPLPAPRRSLVKPRPIKETRNQLKSSVEYWRNGTIALQRCFDYVETLNSWCEK